MTLFPTQPETSPLRAAGFTLNEVLIALGILAIGSVAVASLFPTAAFLQKEAVKETLRQNHTRSADAVLEGVGLDNVTLLEFVELVEFEGRSGTSTYPPNVVRAGMDDPGYDVFALAEVDLHVWSSYDDAADITNNGITTVPSEDTTATGGTALRPDMRMGGGGPTFPGDYDDSYVYDTLNGRYADGRFPVAFRSLPSIQPAVDYGSGPVYVDRELFWVPLVRAGVEASEIIPDWAVYAFLLQPPSQLRTNGVYAMANYAPDFDDPSIVCANPDAANYFPKVFRVPVTWDDSTPNRAVPSVNLYGYVKPGELVLGNNGKIYRVSQVDPTTGTLILASQTLYEPLNDRDLAAVWVAPAPGGINQDSPLADVRLLSNAVVRTSDY